MSSKQVLHSEFSLNNIIFHRWLQTSTPRSLSPSTDRREKPTSAMASKITRLEGTIKSLEEKVASLKQENVSLVREIVPVVCSARSRHDIVLAVYHNC